MHTLGCASNTRARIVKDKTPARTTRGAHGQPTKQKDNTNECNHHRTADPRRQPHRSSTDQGPHPPRTGRPHRPAPAHLLEQEGRTDLRLRIAVQPGGCSGLIYQLYFDERVLDGDAVRNFDGVEVIVDKMSAPYLDGSTIDFEDTIEKQGFSIDNPNAAGSCACGDSFH